MTESRFEALPLAAPIQKALSEKGYTHASPIQAQAIPLLVEGQDLLACAQTGTGKTAAFALPILQFISEQRGRPARGTIRSLVLTPTRELAVQVADSFRTYGKHLRFSLGLVHGGVSQRPQEKSLAGGLDVLVACPGRLLDLMEQGYVNLSEVDVFVLDEADRMLDMGFINDIRKIEKALQPQRQTIFLSATMSKEISQLANQLLFEPAEIRIDPEVTTAEKVEQRLRFLDQKAKKVALKELLDERLAENPDELTLVFSRTKHGANRLAQDLSKIGIPADAIHGNKSQAARQKALDRFRNGKVRVLVATDVAARGIDVKDITLVVNLDLPMEAEAYVHRIGRTARAGASGLAMSFCSAEELSLLRDIEKLIGQSIAVDTEHEAHDADVEAKYRNGAFRNEKPGGGKRGRGGPRGGGGRGRRPRRPGGPRNRRPVRAGR